MAILYNGVERFENIVKALLTESPMSNTVKIAQAVSEKMTLKTSCRLWWPSCISDRHSLSYFRSRDHPVATVLISTQIAPWFRRISQKLVILDIWSAKFYILLIYKSFCCCNISFNSNRKMVCSGADVKEFFFQHGECGGHFGFPINTILAIYISIGLLVALS